jgi:phosphoglycolate phosphatase
MTWRGVVFDKDGVLVDFHATWTPAIVDFAHSEAAGDRERAGELLKRVGYEATSGTFLSGSVWAAGNARDLAAAWLPNAELEAHAALISRLDAHCRRYEQVGLLPRDKLHAVFSALKLAKLFTGIATNDSTASARRSAENLGLTPYLDLILGFDAVRRPKPAADPILEFCDHCALQPSEIVMVGDNVHDMEMARAAGAGLAVGVLSGNSQRDHLEPHADRLIDSIVDLPALLGLSTDLI